MIHFFTDPYKDELIYSAIARYHYYTGNIDYKDTLEECFGRRTIISTLEFTSLLEVLAKNIGGKYTSDYLISRHTLLPYYLPFLPRYRKEEVLYEAKYADCSGIYTQIGFVAGSKCRKDGIYYCPICSENEIERYGEAFIHREHQLQGISLCVHHGAVLKRYKEDKKQISRLQFIRLEKSLLDLKVSSEVIQDYELKLKLAKDAYYIINTELSTVEKSMILEKYKNLLYERGLTTSTGNVKQNELYEEFLNFYSESFLEGLESGIDNDDEYNWLRVITRDIKRTVHPIRHILLINFLIGDISKFFQDINVSYNPFGKGPWPCLNKVSEHYMQEIIDDLRISEDYKTRVPVGTFSCKCGFVYSRQGPDINENDRYRIGRIKNFGNEWEDKLKDYLKSGRYGLRELGRLMHCDPKTIVKFDRLLGINSINSSIAVIPKTEEKLKEDKLEIYKDDILRAIEKDKEASRTEIRSMCKKQYTYIYRHDRQWLFEKLPLLRKNIEHKEKVNWEERDKELIQLIEDKYKAVVNFTIPVRISKAYIGKSLGILAILEKKLDKLPKTEAYLGEICETVEEFQLRRCISIIKQKMFEDSQIRLWEIQRLAAIRSNQFEKIKEKLIDYINNGNTGG